MKLKRQRAAWLLVLAALVTVFSSAVDAARPRAPMRGSELTVTALTQNFSLGSSRSTNHSIQAYYHVPKAAPAGATATLDLPTTLGAGASVGIEIINIRPQKLPPRLLRQLYWGSFEAVPFHQPLSQWIYGADERHYRGGSNGEADPTGLASIGPTASASGDYTAHLSYVGDTTVTFTEAQDFLDPLIITKPSRERIDFTRPVIVTWKPLPRAIAYQVEASMRGVDGRQIVWENAWKSNTWRGSSIMSAVASHHLLGPDETTVTIPAGIFSGGGPVLLRVHAYSAEVSGRGVMFARGWAQSTASLELQDGGR